MHHFAVPEIPEADRFQGQDYSVNSSLGVEASRGLAAESCKLRLSLVSK